jgi:thioesterase domain-containing protein
MATQNPQRLVYLAALCSLKIKNVYNRAVKIDDLYKRQLTYIRTKEEQFVMPFLKFAGKRAHEVSAEKPELPLFLLPDIMGSEKCFTYLIPKLLEENPRLTIYAWKDSRIESGRNNPATIEEISKEITQSINKHLVQNMPCLIGGYSFSGPIAVRVAQLQKDDHQRNTAVCILDSPVPNKSQGYLRPDNTEATQDLVAIMNAAATLSGLTQKMADKKFDSKKTIEQQLGDIFSDLHGVNEQANAELGNLSKFTAYHRIVKQNLKALKACPLDPSKTKVDHILVASTSETMKKYQLNEKLGWGAYVADEKHIGTTSSDGAHTELLGDDNDELPVVMTKFFGGRTLEYHQALASSVTLKQSMLIKQSSKLKLEALEDSDSDAENRSTTSNSDSNSSSPTVSPRSQTKVSQQSTVVWPSLWHHDDKSAANQPTVRVAAKLGQS